MKGFVLDTCAVVWISEEAPLARSGIAALNEAQDAEVPVLISQITAWEIGLLVARNRLKLPLSPHAWWARLMTAPNLGLAELSPRILLDSSFLPGRPPDDPADRIIITTARESDLTIITRDRLILAYAEAGHVRAISC